MESVGPDGQAGYDRVIKLANSLVDLRHQLFVTQSKVDEIVTLWDDLSDHDKGPLIYPPPPPWQTTEGSLQGQPFKDQRDPWHWKSEEVLVSCEFCFFSYFVIIWFLLKFFVSHNLIISLVMLNVIHLFDRYLSNSLINCTFFLFDLADAYLVKVDQLSGPARAV